MAKKLRISTGTGGPTTVEAMLRDTRRMNVGWSAHGMLLNVTTRDAVRLMYDLERQLQPHGSTHVQARVYNPRRAGRWGRVGAKPAPREMGARKEPGVWLWGLIIGAITRRWW